jgi:hypothetical protein
MEESACGFFVVEVRADSLIRSFFNLLGSSYKDSANKRRWITAHDSNHRHQVVSDDPEQGVARTMPLCKFPEKARPADPARSGPVAFPNKI